MGREIREYLIDRFTQSVKKYDILYRADSSIRVVIEYEFSGSEIPLRRSIGIGTIVITSIFHYGLHPLRYPLTLGYWITDILPDHCFYAVFFDVFSDLDDLSDLVLEVFFTLFYEGFSHILFINPRCKKPEYIAECEEDEETDHDIYRPSLCLLRILFTVTSP